MSMSAVVTLAPTNPSSASFSKTIPIPTPMSSKNQDAKPRAEIYKHVQWSDEKGKYECKYLRFERRFVPANPTKCETKESNCGSAQGILRISGGSN